VWDFPVLIFANPVTPASRFHDSIVSYTLALLSHSDERPLLVSPLLGIRLILEVAIAMRSSQTIIREAQVDLAKSQKHRLIQYDASTKRYCTYS